MPYKKPIDPTRVDVDRLESEAPAQPPTQPTDTLPGTEEHLRVLRRRVARREELRHKKDAEHGKDKAPVFRRDGRYLRFDGELTDARLEPGERGFDREATFGGRLKKLRLARGMTYGMLAEASGVAKATIASLERNRGQEPTLRNLLALAEALRVSLDELAGKAPLRAFPACEKSHAKRG